MKPSEMVSLLNSSWQNRKERQNRSTNNEDMVDRAKCLVSEYVSLDTYVIREKLSF